MDKGKRGILVALISIIIVVRIGGYVLDKLNETRDIKISGKVREEIKIDGEVMGGSKGGNVQTSEINTEEGSVEDNDTKENGNENQNKIEETGEDNKDIDEGNKDIDEDNKDIDEDNKDIDEDNKDEQIIDNNVEDGGNKQVYGESFINYSDIENIEGEYILVATFISCQTCKDMKKEVVEYMENGGKRKIYNIDIRNKENRDYIINTGAKTIPTTLIIENSKVKKIMEGVINSQEFDTL